MIALLLAFSASEVFAQQSGNPPGSNPPGGGNGRGGNGNGSDRSGTPPGTTPPGGGYGRGGRNGSIAPAAAALTVGSPIVVQVNAALRSGSLTGPRGVRLPDATQSTLLRVLVAAGDDDGALANALSAPFNQSARPQAVALVQRLHGLLAAPERLHEAVVAFNGLVDASSAEFLKAPPAEFVAIQAVLTPLVQPGVPATASR